MECCCCCCSAGQLPGALLLMANVLACKAVLLPQLHGSSFCVALLLVHLLIQHELTSISPSQTSVAADGVFCS
jgi:hypothetical protein